MRSAKTPIPTVFGPLCQVPDAREAQNFEVRTALPQAAMAGVIQKAVAA